MRAKQILRMFTHQDGTAVTDDIVTRLRGQRTNSVLCEEAADEIERLRDACDYYHKMCSMIADKNFTANEEIHRLQEELEASRSAVSGFIEMLGKIGNRNG